MIAGMIGSLQVATTFVPLDVSAPVERTMQMLLDLKSRTVITDRDLAEVLEILCQFFNLQHNVMRRIDYDQQIRF